MDTKHRFRSMTYRERLQPWAVIRLLPNMQHVTIRRFRNASDADGYAKALRQLDAGGKFVVIFAPQGTETLYEKQTVTKEEKVLES